MEFCTGNKLNRNVKFPLSPCHVSVLCIMSCEASLVCLCMYICTSFLPLPSTPRPTMPLRLMANLRTRQHQLTHLKDLHLSIPQRNIQSYLELMKPPAYQVLNIKYNYRDTADQRPPPFSIFLILYIYKDSYCSRLKDLTLLTYVHVTLHIDVSLTHFTCIEIQGHLLYICRRRISGWILHVHLLC